MNTIVHPFGFGFGIRFYFSHSKWRVIKAIVGLVSEVVTGRELSGSSTIERPYNI